MHLTCADAVSIRRNDPLRAVVARRVRYREVELAELALERVAVVMCAAVGELADDARPVFSSYLITPFANRYSNAGFIVRSTACDAMYSDFTGEIACDFTAEAAPN